MKRLLKAILWIFCYGGALGVIIKAKLGFNILDGKNWKILFDDSPRQVWPAQMASKKFLCKVLLLFIIVGILGLSVVLRKKKSRIPVVKGELDEKNNFRPSPLATQGRISPPLAPAISPSTSLNYSSSPPTATATSSNLMGDIVKEITQEANQFDISVFPHVKLENTFTQLVVSDDSTALLLKVLAQPVTWQVSQPLDSMECLWTAEGVPSVSIKDIIQSTQTLSRLEPEANAIAVIILAGGDLEEPQKVKSYLNEHGIQIASFLPDDQKIPDIPDWKELLGKFYPLKENDENNMNI